MKKIILLICCGFISICGNAQMNTGATKQSNHSIAFFYGLNQHKDNNLFGVVHSGGLFRLDYKWAKVKRSISEFELKGGYSTLQHPFETGTDSEGSFAAVAHVQYSRLFPTKNDNLHIGGALVYWSLLPYYPYWEEQHIYWATSGNIALALRHNFTHKDKQHRLSFQTPLLATVSRPAENPLTLTDNISFNGFIGHLHSNFELGTVNKHFGVLMSYEYIFPIGNKNMGIIANFNYQRLKTSISQPFQQLQYLIGSKFIF